MGKIAIFQVKKEKDSEVLIQASSDTFETTEEAKKHLRFAGCHNETYQIVQLTARVKCETSQQMKLIETENK